MPERHRPRPYLRGDPSLRYIRRNSRASFEVRIPCDGRGQVRLNLGSFSTLARAQAERDMFLWRLKVARKPPEEIHFAARARAG